jgi:hypothetical protein
MLCSWSYNGTNPVNPYAWVAWLTANLVSKVDMFVRLVF